MPTLFDQYKSMDRGSTKRFAAGGGKETIKKTLMVAAKDPYSQIPTVMLISALLNFKAAQARDKGNTEVLERMLASLPMRIAAVNKLRPKYVYINNIKIDFPDDLNEFHLRAFIANSSSVFQKQIPATFRALLVEVLGIQPSLKGYLVNSYTAQFLCDNKLIDKAEVGPALIVGTRERPTNSQMKMFIEQCLNWLEFIHFSPPCIKPFWKIALQFQMDATRYKPVGINGFGQDKTWLNHVFKCYQLIEAACESNKSWSDVKKFVQIMSDYKEVKLLLQSVKDNMTIYPRAKANWLLFVSLQQGFVISGSTVIRKLHEHWLRSQNGVRDEQLNYTLPCSLPGGWEDMRHIYFVFRYASPTSYDEIKQSFKLKYFYELFWVQNPVSGFSLVEQISDPNFKPPDFRTDSQGQATWWVTATLEFKFIIPSIDINLPPPPITLLPTEPHYEVEVFNSKPEYPKIKWPSLF